MKHEPETGEVNSVLEWKRGQILGELCWNVDWGLVYTCRYPYTGMDWRLQM